VGIAERQARDKEALRNKILEAASRIFVEEGVESVSIRRIAERIEYAPSTIYLYFNDKSDLLETICRETFRLLNEHLGLVNRSVTDGAVAPREGLERGLRAFIEFGLEHPHHYMATFSPAGWLQRTGDADFTKHPGYPSYEYLRHVVAACMETGAIRKADLEVTCQCVLMALHGVTSMLILAQGGSGFPWAAPEQLIDESMGTLLRGLQ
jgi:AcrR family transcriptional regulator